MFVFPCFTAIVLDFEVTSSVLARLVDSIYSSLRLVASPASVNPIQPTSSSSTADDEKSLEVTKYHGGWCVVAARRDLEKSHRADRHRLLAYIDLFGSDVATVHRPCLENFSIIEVCIAAAIYITNALENYVRCPNENCIHV